MISTDLPPDQVAEHTLEHAVNATLLDGHPMLERCLAELDEVDRRHPVQVERRLGLVLDRAVRTAGERGWQPSDLSEYARRKLSPRAGPLLVDAMAAEHARYSAATTDPKWQRQLDQLCARIWWDRDRPHFAQWAARHGLPRSTALRTAVGLLGFLLRLPRLPRLLPLPGTTGGHSPVPRQEPVDEKMLGRIRALLAKAESTEFPEEAEALSGKAQELMARFSLDRALVEAGIGRSAASDGQARVTGGPAARRIWLEAPYVSAKSHLAGSVAAANHCRTVSYDQLGFVTVIGAEVDIGLVELLTTSLLLQAGRAMHRAGSRTGRRGESRTRSFRHSFLLSYAVRIGERLRAATSATEAAVNEAESGRLLPVLAKRSEEVDQLFKELFPHTVRRGVSVSNAEGWAAGRTAADQAYLSVRPAVGGD